MARSNSSEVQRWINLRAKAPGFALSNLTNEQQGSPADLLQICPRSLKMLFFDAVIFPCLAAHLEIDSKK